MARVIPGSSSAYRPDVDGVRALAVLAVLGYHAFPAALPGGFVGVDVFFVISGFLITGILLGELAAGRFTFSGFYWRRVRRIFPALAIVLAATLALGWRVLLPDEYSLLGKHVAAGAAFVSNIALWREAGYFDAAAELKPLLHLWSLGIEEQYYLGWPLLLFVFRGNPRRMLAMIAAVGLASFALNVALVDAHGAADFYLPATRIWELLAGSLLAFLVAQGKVPAAGRELRAGAGALLIVAALALLDGSRHFPGWWALVPVAGTALVLSAGPAAWLNRRLFSRRPVVYLGLISYPLYLWHWPLLSYARIIHGGEAPLALRLALLATALVLSALTYELVEKPIRRARAGLLARRTVPALGAAMAVLLVAGVAAKLALLAPRSASDPAIAEIARAASDWDGTRDRILLGDSPRAVLFFGDSHMEHYLPRVRKLLHEHYAPLHTVIFKTEGGCAPVPGIERRGQHCSSFVDEGFRLAHAKNVETVVIAASWVGFVSRGDYRRAGDPDGPALDLMAPSSDWVYADFEAALAGLVAEGKRVVLVLSSPRGRAFAPKSVLRRDWMTVKISHPLGAVPKAKVEEVIRPIDERLKRLAQRAGALVIDPTEWLCQGSLCPATDALGRPLYMDDSHIRASVARSRLRALDGFVYLHNASS
jgi:peptidoglycan/LPS O-acetylase OafA/YrhL